MHITTTACECSTCISDLHTLSTLLIIRCEVDNLMMILMKFHFQFYILMSFKISLIVVEFETGNDA